MALVCFKDGHGWDDRWISTTYHVLSGTQPLVLVRVHILVNGIEALFEVQLFVGGVQFLYKTRSWENGLLKLVDKKEGRFGFLDADGRTIVVETRHAELFRGSGLLVNLGRLINLRRLEY